MEKNKNHPDLMDILNTRLLFSDGAIGTYIQSKLDGKLLNYKKPLECLNIDHPEIIEQIHREYIESGADIITLNTFNANPEFFAEKGIEQLWGKANIEGYNCASKAVMSLNPSRRIYISGSIGPGYFLPSLNQEKAGSFYNLIYQQFLLLSALPIDLIQLETGQDILAAKIAAQAVKDIIKTKKIRMPLFIQFSIDINGKTVTGSNLDCITQTFSSVPAEGIGLNCGTGPDELIPFIQRLNNTGNKYTVISPNAGIPILKDGKPYYPLSPEDYAFKMTQLIIKSSPSIVGGCCGTTPLHIEILRKKCKEKKLIFKKINTQTQKIWGLTSLFSFFPFQKNKLFIINEKGNSLGNKKLRNLLKKFSKNEISESEIIDYVYEVSAKKTQGIDFCFALPGENELLFYRSLLPGLNKTVDLPFCIDSSDPETIEYCSRTISGKFLINSINFNEPEKIPGLIRSVKNSGSSVIVLAMGEGKMGIKKEEKIRYLSQALDKLINDYQISPNDIFLDPLVFPLFSGDNKFIDSAGQTVRALEYFQQEYPQIKTIIGLSNISYGLPRYLRKYINSAFLHHCKNAGLSAAIMDPPDEKIYQKIDHTTRIQLDKLLFSNNKSTDKKIEKLMKIFPENSIKTEMGISVLINEFTPEKQLFQAIYTGKPQNLQKTMDSALRKNSPENLINNYCLPAMRNLGKDFSNGKIPLPFILRSAEVMKFATDYLGKKIKSKKHSTLKKLLICTVKGDIHDIGKNLASIIFSNNGFEVKDLRTDCSKEFILKETLEFSPDIIGLSGLIIPSLSYMIEILDFFRDHGLGFPFILGGAIIEEKFVQKISKNYLFPVLAAKDLMSGLAKVDRLLNFPKNGNTPDKLDEEGL